MMEEDFEFCSEMFSDYAFEENFDIIEMDLEERKKKLADDSLLMRLTDEHFVSGDKLTGDSKVAKDDSGMIRLITPLDHHCDDDVSTRSKMILKTMSNIDPDSDKDEYASDNSSQGMNKKPMKESESKNIQATRFSKQIIYNHKKDIPIKRMNELNR